MKLIKKCCVIPALMSFVFFFFSCAKDIVDLHGSVGGTVYDSRTGEPLSGVVMTLSPSGKTISTGSDGRYEFQTVEPGSYSVQAVRSGYESDNRTVSVTAGETSRLDFQLTPSVAGLKVSQSTLDFGNSYTTLGLDLKNDGNAVLEWEISEDASWLSCVPTSGAVESGESVSVVVNVDRSGMERGSYSQTITVSSNGGSSVVRVNMTVQGVSLEISPETLDFGSTSSSMQLTLTNNGQGSISYTIGASKDWVRPGKTSGTFSSSEIITVSVDRSGFSEGDYEASLSLRANDEDFIVPVRMNIPSKAKPTVSLHSVDGVTFNTAMFKGAVVTVGSSKVVSHGFCWNTSGEPTVESSGKCNLGDCATAEDFSYNASSLEPDTEYYVRAYAENIEGISYSNQLKFKTNGTPRLADVETGAISGIQSSQCIAGGNILNLGNVDEIDDYGHVWSIDANPTLADSKISLGKTSSTGAFNSTITGLQPNRTYHVRAYATNRIGTSYGDDVVFSTVPGKLVVRTSPATDITYNSASCGGEITDYGGNDVAECGICWDTSSSPMVSANTSVAKSPADKFTFTLSGLSPTTTYYVRAYARTVSGSVCYGQEVTFTTSAKDVQVGIGDFGEDKHWNK